jgi:hypothetical protein
MDVTSALGLKYELKVLVNGDFDETNLFYGGLGF